jgi:hypothetical protein
LQEASTTTGKLREMVFLLQSDSKQPRTSQFVTDYSAEGKEAYVYVSIAYRQFISLVPLHSFTFVCLRPETVYNTVCVMTLALRWTGGDKGCRER